MVRVMGETGAGVGRQEATQPEEPGGGPGLCLRRDIPRSVTHPRVLCPPCCQTNSKCDSSFYNLASWTVS